MTHAQAFHETGFLRIEDAFARDAAHAMCDVIWNVLEQKFEISSSDRSTWGRPFRTRPIDEIGDSELFWSPPAPRPRSRAERGRRASLHANA